MNNIKSLLKETTTLIMLLLLPLCLVASISSENPGNNNLNIADEPLKILMITGGGPWHDYEVQKKLIADGLKERLNNIEITIDHEGGQETNFKFTRHENTNWAKEFDLVIYNHCHLYMEDGAYVDRIIDAHVENQVPAVMLHCPMHVYQNASERWFDFTGAESYFHEDRIPFTVEVLEQNHPIMINFPRTWRTPHGELYMISELKEGALPLAHAYGIETKKYHPIAWTYNYQGVNVFSSTLGHHDETMGADVNLNLIASGVLWAAGKLQDDGSPAAGYEGERGLGWISLWDGESIKGWRASEQTNWHTASRYTWKSMVALSESFNIEGDKIVANGKRSNLFYDGPVNGGDFKNFELNVEVLTYPASNSGIFFHTRYQDYGRPIYGYQAKINTIENVTHTPEYSRRKTGSMVPVIDIPNVIHENNAWFNYSIIVNDANRKVLLNGEVISEFNEPAHYEGTLGRGTIALENSGPENRVYFKNIMIRLWPD